MIIYIVLINGAVIAYSFLCQKTVTLSVTEAEYLETADMCCKIICVHDILFFMLVVDEYPIIFHIDNIELYYYRRTWCYPKNACHHFIRDYVEDRTLKI